jgi:hypothetical protein
MEELQAKFKKAMAGIPEGESELSELQRRNLILFNELGNH